jgi:hypothetical protein
MDPAALNDELRLIVAGSVVDEMEVGPGEGDGLVG